MKTTAFLESLYARLGRPELANFALAELREDTKYNFGAFVLADHVGQVILIRRKPIAKHPGIENYWWIPGGARENDEQLDQTAIREFREETGLSVAVHRILLAQLARDRPFIAVVFRGSVVGGTASAGADPDNITAEARAFPRHSIAIGELWMDTCKILLAREGFVVGDVEELIRQNGLRALGVGDGFHDVTAGCAGAEPP